MLIAISVNDGGIVKTWPSVDVPFSSSSAASSSSFPLSSTTSFGFDNFNPMSLLTSRVIVALSNTFLTSRFRTPTRNVPWSFRSSGFRGGRYSSWGITVSTHCWKLASSSRSASSIIIHCTEWRLNPGVELRCSTRRPGVQIRMSSLEV